MPGNITLDRSEKHGNLTARRLLGRRGHRKLENPLNGDLKSTHTGRSINVPLAVARPSNRDQHSAPGRCSAEGTSSRSRGSSEMTNRLRPPCFAMPQWFETGSREYLGKKRLQRVPGSATLWRASASPCSDLRRIKDACICIIHASH
jgi:hypothetical protein